jgi:seryl-tRNA synthetase
VTKTERRSVRNGFRALERAHARDKRHLEQSIGKLDVAEREHHVEIRDELRKINKRLAAIEKTADETSRHAKFTSASIEQLKRALETAGVIDKLDEGRPGTAYSQVINPKGRDRR